MASIVLAVTLIWLQATGFPHMYASAQTFQSNCQSAYKAISPQHTMCMSAGPGTAVSVDSNDVTSYHNAKRALQTNATDLVKVYWDAEVAKVAGHWAKQCSRYGPHDQKRGVPTLPGTYIGQNVASGYRTFRAAIDGWYDEINHFRYGQGSTNGNAVGHYTQMVSKEVFRIGCGQALCQGNTNVYVCNYVTGWHDNKPYTEGKQCSACPRSCSSGQCDCKGLICLNSGTLDKNNCSCSCQPNVQGKNCGTVACPQTSTDWRCQAMSAKYCEFKWTGTDTYIKYICPVLCGLCKAGQTQTAPSGEAVDNSSPSGSTQSTQSSNGQTSGGTQPTPSPGGSQSQGTSGNAGQTSGGASNQDNTNSQTSSGSGTCEDNWACSHVNATKCQPRSYLNGKLVLDLCPQLCGKCGSSISGQTDAGAGAGNSNPPASSGNTESSSSNSGSCTDNWACDFTTASRCVPQSYLNGKLVTELCPRLCNTCGGSSARRDSGADGGCTDSLMCTIFPSTSCSSNVRVSGQSVLQLCPKKCNQC